jgi:hypothetical protein
MSEGESLTRLATNGARCTQVEPSQVDAWAHPTGPTRVGGVTWPIRLSEGP